MNETKMDGTIYQPWCFFKSFSSSHLFIRLYIRIRLFYSELVIPKKIKLSPMLDNLIRLIIYVSNLAPDFGNKI